MAQLFKRNETITVPAFKNGVTIQFFNLSFPSDVSAKLSADNAGFVAGTYSAEEAKSPVARALEAIHARVSIEIIGAVQNNGAGAGRDVRIGVAAIGGNYPTDNYDGTAGNETMAAYLQVLVRAASSTNSVSYQGVDLNSCLVTAFTI